MMSYKSDSWSVAVSFSLLFVLTLSLSECARPPYVHSQGGKELSAERPERKAVVIPLDVRPDTPETETRILISYVSDRPKLLLLQMEPPFYRLEFLAMSPAAQPLAWAPGAEHVYSGESGSVHDPDMTLSEHPRILPGEHMFLIAERGRSMWDNELAAWEVKSDPLYPVAFKVVSGVGYVYMYGRGEVRSPSGQIQKVGQTDTVDGWIGELSDPDAFRREAAAQALGWLGNSRAVPALCQALTDAMPLVRRSAAESLGRIGDRGAAEALQSATADKHAWTAETARWALKKIGRPKNGG